MIERHPIAPYAHGCYVTSMSKKEIVRIKAGVHVNLSEILVTLKRG